MNKKFTVCLCTLALLCSSFAGCGAAETSSAPADSTPNETAASATQAAAPAAPEAENQADSAVPEEAAKPEGNPFSIVLPGRKQPETAAQFSGPAAGNGLPPCIARRAASMYRSDHRRFRLWG